MVHVYMGHSCALCGSCLCPGGWWAPRVPQRPAVTRAEPHVLRGERERREQLGVEGGWDPWAT